MFVFNGTLETAGAMRSRLGSVTTFMPTNLELVRCRIKNESYIRPEQWNMALYQQTEDSRIKGSEREW